MAPARFIVADVFDGLATLEDGSVDLVVTSPPFLALRSYLPADHPDKSKEIGSEATPAEFLDVLLRVTAELRRVLAPHGSIAVELGDTYAGSGESGWERDKGEYRRENRSTASANGQLEQRRDLSKGWPLAKSKTLIPELYRIALAYGINPLTGQPSPAGRWRVRNNVTWCRPNPPVGALGDKWRPATSDVVVACVSDKRYWDDIATRRPYLHPNHPQNGKTLHGGKELTGEKDGNWDTFPVRAEHPAGAPLLDYWEIPPGGYPGSHYAVFPPALVEPLIKAMAPPKICRTCGEPQRRIVDHQRILTGEQCESQDARQAAAHGKALNNFAAGASGISISRETLGWTDCGHRCPHCDDEGWMPAVEDMQGDFVEPCAHCNGTNNWRPALILDPFAGSGTTLSVATGHGHDALGIDLDERNADLAKQRIGPMLFERAV